MNIKIQEFIDRKKEEKKASELKKRDEHLISLGLVDESRSTCGIKYLDNWNGSKECQWDDKKGKYYIKTEVPAAIEVTDEEYEEILKYSSPTTENVKMELPKTKWSKTIEITAFICLIAGVAFGIFGIATAKSYSPNYDTVIAESISTIIYVCISFPLIMGFSKIVAAAEKYLHKQ